MELTNIRFTLSKTHELSRESEFVKCIFLATLLLLVVFVVPGEW